MSNTDDPKVRAPKPAKVSFLQGTQLPEREDKALQYLEEAHALLVRAHEHAKQAYQFHPSSYTSSALSAVRQALNRAAGRHAELAKEGNGE